MPPNRLSASTRGQCAEIYPKKPIYDIPSRPEILAGDLVDQLMTQIQPFKPGFTLGETAQEIHKERDGSFVVTTDKGTQHHAQVVAIAGGLGTFEPRKPDLANLIFWEDKGVDYIIREPEKYRNKNVLIAGGGDSALDWTIVLAELAQSVTLVHRRNQFRGALDSVQKVQALKDQNKIQVITPAEVIALDGDRHLTNVTLKVEGTSVNQAVDYFIPLLDLPPNSVP